MSLVARLKLSRVSARIVGLVLLLAAGMKAITPCACQGALRQLVTGLGFTMPESLIFPLCLALIYIEALVGLSLLLTDEPTAAAHWAIVLLVSLSLFRLFMPGSCACFGTLARASLGVDLGRNALLLLLLVGYLGVCRPRRRWLTRNWRPGS